MTAVRSSTHDCTGSAQSASAAQATSGAGTAFGPFESESGGFITVPPGGSCVLAGGVTGAGSSGITPPPPPFWYSAPTPSLAEMGGVLACGASTSTFTVHAAERSARRVTVTPSFITPGNGARARTLSVFFLALAVCGGVGCSTTRQEARSVIEAVDRFRKAENVQKPELADALAKVPCSDPEVCATKDACVKSATATARGLRLQREVEDGLAQVKAGTLDKSDPKAIALGPKLDEVDKALAEGNDALATCDDKLTSLRVKYR